MFYLIDTTNNHGFTDGVILLTTESAEEAIRAARDQWARKTSSDKRHSRIEIREYVEDIEREDCECYDYTSLNWSEE